MQTQGVAATRGYVLLVGGVGYVGYNLARYYSSAGASVVATARPAGLRRRPRLAASMRSLRGTVIELVESPKGLAGLLERQGCPAKAYVLIGKLRGKGIWGSNYAATSYAEVIMERCPGSLVVFTSALAVYGKGASRRCGTPVPVDEECGCCRPRSAYARAKLEVEHALRAAAERHGARVFIARLGLVAGRRPYHPEWRLLLGLHRRLPVRLSSNAMLHITSPRHLAEAVEAAPTGRAVVANVVSLRITLSDLSSALAERLGWRRLVVPAPGRRVLRLLESLLPGPLGDTAWSFYAPAAAPGWLPPGPGLAEVVGDLLAESPEA